MIGLKLMDIIPKDQFYPSTHFLQQKALIQAKARAQQQSTPTPPPQIATPEAPPEPVSATEP